jgi:flagellar basal-body rod modification protein FlgD
MSGSSPEKEDRMSIIQPLSSTGINTTTPTTAPTTPKDEFMRLFIAQLQHQDPLQPQDSSAFVAQLAQLSQLEQSTETNTHLTSIADSQSAAARASLSALVGHQVTASADTIEVRAGVPQTGIGAPAVTVHLDATAASAQLDIVDAAGHTTRSLDLGAHGAGDVAVDWSKASDLPPGSYTLAVHAKSGDGAAVTGNTQVTGVIDAMQIGEAGGRFRIGNFNVAPASVISVGAATR